LYDTFIDISTAGDTCVVTVKSEIDVANAETLRRYVDEASSGVPRLVVSLAGCSYIDSSGLAPLIGWARSRGDAFGCVVPSGSRAHRVFELTRLRDIMRVYETLDEALRSDAGKHALA
jgi:anti-anti-sigma factor